MMPRKPVIAVIGSGRGTEPTLSNAREIGRLIAEHGWVLITGGRDAGVMKAANEGAKRTDGSLTVGILPDQTTKVSPDVDVAIITGVGEARNNIIVLSADVVIACGASDPGTASEVLLATKAGKPVILVATDPAAREFLKELGGDSVRFVDGPSEAIAAAEKMISFHG